MKKTRTEKPALDMVEEAMGLLRRCPLGVWLFYYIGTVPFVLGLLYFWADMSRGAFAEDHLIEASLAVAATYAWCKVWQAMFASTLVAIAGQRPPPTWTAHKIWRVTLAQTALQPTGLLLMPIAILITLPAGVAFAFYQNLSALALDGIGDAAGTREVRREAMLHARRWMGQNHFALGVLCLFWVIVFANIMVAILSVPSLLKSLAGVETMFSRSMYSMFNTTIFAAAAGLTYLCVDPVFKAFYALRCFNGRAIATGEDLQVELRIARHRRLAMAAALLATAFLCIGFPTANAGLVQKSPPPAHTAEIDHAITDVLTRPEFAWRAQRVVAPEARKSKVITFFNGVGKLVRKWTRPLRHAIARFFRWLGRRMMNRAAVSADTSGSRSDWLKTLRYVAWIAGIAAAGVLAFVGWRLWRQRIQPIRAAAQPTVAMPDLTAPDITADQLPEDGWLRLAQEMISRGELRLALRAFYLAGLAHLGEREAVRIERYKSNHDYERELLRRRPAAAELRAAFASAVRAFERVWYGAHDVTPETLDEASRQLDIIRKEAA